MSGFKERVVTARKFLPEFGLAGPWGFGREPETALPQILDGHLSAIEFAGA